MVVSESMSIENEIVAAIRRIMRAVDLHSRRLVEEHGLTGPQLAVLQEADRLGPVTAGALARAVHLSQPTVSGILDRLNKRGLVDRRRGDRDRRSVIVTVTTLGQAALSTTPSLLQDSFRSELAKLEDWERSMIFATLQRIATMMDAEAISASPVLVTGPFGDGTGDLPLDASPSQSEAAGGDDASKAAAKSRPPLNPNRN
jgi:DNA-binding MarR family transcriptional regulator